MSMVPAEITQSEVERPSEKKDAAASLPKLPIPKLEDTCKKYLRALEGLQDGDEHARSKRAVEQFLSSGEGQQWQKRLEEYNETVDSYIEEFWCR
jgi:carnitine O-acetyltransferase